MSYINYKIDKWVVLFVVQKTNTINLRFLTMFMEKTIKKSKFFIMIPYKLVLKVSGHHWLTARLN
jgi:hypothetical protein